MISELDDIKLEESPKKLDLSNIEEPLRGS